MPPPAVQLFRHALPPLLCERWLAAVAAPEPVSRALPQLSGLDPAELLRAVAASVLGLCIDDALGPGALCNLSQSWLRHGRPPHSWHQDGALRFDFMAHAGRAPPAEALLHMRTCWIALTPCGVHAPGLAWVAEATPRLLQPSELRDEAVAARFTRFVRPEMQAGDAVLFDGQLLHRTHLVEAMTLPRCSLELRFFPAGPLPPRVAGDLFAAFS